MIADFLSHNLLLFIITTITSAEILYYAQRVVEDSSDFTLGKKILCGGLNSFILLSVLMGGDSGFHILLLLIGCPLIIIMEMLIFTKDKPLSFLFLYIKLAMNFMSMFWIVAALAATRSQIPGYTRVIMAFTLIVTGSMALFFAKMKKYPMKELHLMVHDWKKGKIFFVYLTLADLFLLASSFLLSPFLQSVLLEGTVKTIVAMEVLLKTLAILGFSYILLYLIAKDIRSEREYKQIKNTLESEKRFRSTVQKKGIMNVQVNVTKGILRDGREYFLDKSWVEQRNFEGVIRMIARKIVHPADQEAFKNSNTVRCIKEQLQTTPYFSQKIRVSPREIVRYFYLKEPFRKQYEVSNKTWVWIKIDYIYTQDIETGDIFMFLVIFDVDEEITLKEKLHLSATTDALTGLLNRTIMQYEIEKKLVDSQYTGTMILIDIDNFKTINDRLGHPIGDQVLIRFSKLLGELFRKNDVIGRLGGDEFAVFIPGVLSAQALEDKVKELNHRAIFSYETESGEEIKTSASIGIVISGFGDSYETLYKKADEALYRSKEKGKSTYTFYS